LTVPVADKIMQSSKSDKDMEQEYSRIVQAYFSLRKDFETVYDQR